MLIAQRACGASAIGVIVCITFSQDARGVILREGMEVRLPGSAIGLIDQLIPIFQWRPLFWPRGRKVSGTAGPEAHVNSRPPQQ